MESPKKERPVNEPWLGLKLIAAYRVRLPDPKDVNDEVLRDYAKWQICKARNKLFKDPIWDDYTDEEILIEFFGIIFEQNPEALEEFVNKTKTVDKDINDWFDRMAKEHEEKMKQDQETGKDEFEDTYDGK